MAWHKGDNGDDVYIYIYIYVLMCIYIKGHMARR